MVPFIPPAGCPCASVLHVLPAANAQQPHEIPHRLLMPLVVPGAPKPYLPGAHHTRAAESQMPPLTTFLPKRWNRGQVWDRGMTRCRGGSLKGKGRTLDGKPALSCYHSHNRGHCPATPLSPLTVRPACTWSLSQRDAAHPTAIADIAAAHADSYPRGTLSTACKMCSGQEGQENLQNSYGWS